MKYEYVSESLEVPFIADLSNAWMKFPMVCVSFAQKVYFFVKFVSCQTSSVFLFLQAKCASVTL